MRQFLIHFFIDVPNALNFSPIVTISTNWDILVYSGKHFKFVPILFWNVLGSVNISWIFCSTKPDFWNLIGWNWLFLKKWNRNGQTRFIWMKEREKFWGIWKFSLLGNIIWSIFRKFKSYSVVKVGKKCCWVETELNRFWWKNLCKFTHNWCYAW